MAEREVKVKIGADTSGLKTGLNSANGMLAKFGGAAGIAKAAGAALGVTVGAVAAGMVALTRRSLEQIDAQAKLAQSLGTTVTSMQTLKRAGDLAGVSMGGIQQASSDLTRRLSQAASGAGPVADALDRLNLSAAALSQVPLDERILTINEALDKFIPATERAAVAGQLFGEEGSLAMARIDTATLKQATEDVHRFGVVVSEQDADQIETANDAVSRLGLVMEGLGNRMATVAAPAIEATANALVEFAGNIIGVRIELDEFFGTLENAKAMLGEELFAKLFDSPDKIREYATSLDEIVVEMDSLKTIAATAVPQLQILADELDDLGEEKAATAMRNFAEEIVQAKADLESQIITIEEFNAKIADIAIRSKEVVDEFEKINGADFSTAFGNIAKLATGLWEAATAARAARAAMNAAFFEQSDAGQRLARYGSRATTSDQPILMQNPSALAPTSSIRPQQPGVDSYPGADTGGGGGAGAGIKDMFAQRLEALQEGLQTEAETVQAWYDDGLTTLQTALERKMVTEEEYRALRERLEQEHQERISNIRGASDNQQLKDSAEFFGALANVVKTGGGKAVKAAQILGAAQGMINSYIAFTEVLKDPAFIGRPWARIASAAGVLAAGLNMVNAIRGVNASGGSAGGGGVSAAGAVASGGGTTETRTANINFYGGFQPTQETIGMIASGLNDWLGDGGRLNMRTA